MPSLFDMLSQNSDAMQQMSRQFGLSPDQTQSAIEALLPAFSQGLKRNASDPSGIGAFLNAISTGQHARYFEDASAALSPQGMAEGNGILGHLFGSKDVSRAVAAQASQATGIGQDLLKQMLPVLASMIMGGLFKQSTGQMQAGGFGGANNPLGQILEQMMGQGGQRGGNPMGDNPLGQILEGMFGGGGAAQQPRGQSPYGGDNPLGKIFEEMLGGGQAGQAAPRQAPSPRAAPQRRTNPSGRQRNPYDDLFGDMFETGAKTRDDYQRNVESIFDQFLQGMERPRRR